MMFYQKALRAHMVCVLISVCLYSIPSYSQSNMQTPVTIHADGRTLREVFKELEQKTGFTINYQDNLVDAGKKIKLRVNEQPFAKVLQQLLAGTGITFKQQNSMIMLIRKPQQQSPVKKDTGRVYGIIIDEENGQPVASATIQIDSRSFTADIDGAFALALAEGNYMATISNVGYGTKQITDIEVENNRALELNITLKRNRDNLSAVVVKASARKESVASFYVRQKNNAAMSDGISAEQIRATPDNNAAQVLKRISGLTVQDDKFVTVRGLSERYNNVLLNGANLPGTEPNRKNFSFDIVPSALINDIVVNKTATPDLSAEFAGGLVQINMRDVPSDNIGSVTIGSGFNTNSTGKSLYSTPRGNREFLAADDGRRTWWEKKLVARPVPYLQHTGK